MGNTELIVVSGSLMDVAQRGGTSLADAFVNVDAVVIVDVSGSMGQHDSRGGKQRYAVACEELAKLQRELPGRFLVLSFSDRTEVCIGGVPVFQGGGTNLSGALSYARQFDVSGLKFFIVSDGEPDSEERALGEASKFKGTISCVYVGPESDPHGRDFLNKLAQSHGGQSTSADRVMELAERVTLMLGAGA